MGPESWDDRVGPGGRTGSESSRSAGETSGDASHGLRVLSVDDHPAQAELIALMLEPLGYHVETAFSGETAIEMLRAAVYDLVVTDVGLGDGMNGWELTAHVRQRYPHIRVYLATGWGAHIDPQDAQRRGIDGVLCKPFRVAELREMLEPPHPAHRSLSLP
jgi:CheY-like chemotaxis protein